MSCSYPPMFNYYYAFNMLYLIVGILMNKITAWSASPAKSLYQGNSETEILTFKPFGFSRKKFPAVIFLGKNAPVSPLRVVVSVGT